MTKIAILKSGFNWELSQKDINEGEDTKKWLEFMDAQIALAKEFQLEHMETNLMLVDSDVENLKRCEYCTQWGIDRDLSEEENIDIKPIRNGANVAGLFYCERCLPEDHQWAL